MSTTIYIHPKDHAKGMTFSACSLHRPENANSVSLDFNDNQVSIFGLSAATAEILASVGMLNDSYREELLPVLRHLLDAQAAEAEVAAETDKMERETAQ